jgi:hypothetical protein
MLMTCTAHLSHFFQVIDGLLSRRLKTAKKYVARENPVYRSIDHLVRILRADETVTASMTIRESSEEMGFSYENKDQTSYFAVNEGRIRTTPDSREIWESHFPMDGLSARKRNEK